MTKQRALGIAGSLRDNFRVISTKAIQQIRSPINVYMKYEIKCNKLGGQNNSAIIHADTWLSLVPSFFLFLHLEPWCRISSEDLHFLFGLGGQS